MDSIKLEGFKAQKVMFGKWGGGEVKILEWYKTLDPERSMIAELVKWGWKNNL